MLELKIFLSILFTFLNIVDIITTNQILARDGEEMNPIIRVLMKFNLFIPVKIISNIFIVYIILISPIKTGIICCAIMSIFGINNCIQLYLDSKEV
jgi:hypothetical protein